MRQVAQHRHADCIWLSGDTSDATTSIAETSTITTVTAADTLGKRIRAHREGLGMTQGELAARARIRQPSLSDIEGDKTKEITARTLGALCRALGMRWEYALYGTGPVEPVERDLGLTPEALSIAKWFDKLTDPRDRAVAETGAMGVILRVLQKHDLPPTDKPAPGSEAGTPSEPTPSPAPKDQPKTAKTQKPRAEQSGRKG
jgi:transcriptional regulator with XRE-family HTH domain